VQESALGNPAPPLDQFLMHDGNLTSRPPETDETEFEPEGESLPETDLRHCGIGAMGGCHACIIFSKEARRPLKKLLATVSS
jgi:hypothetical protein